jgi:hypothetical protein
MTLASAEGSSGLSETGEIYVGELVHSPPRPGADIAVSAA